MVGKIILAGFVVLLPVGVQAQGRGAMPRVSHAAAAAPRVAMPALHAAPSQMAPAPRTVARGGTVRPRTATPVARSTRRPGSVTARRRFDRFDGEDVGRRPSCNSAPGLGFDAVHQAAVCGSGTGGSRGRGEFPAFFPFFDGGFFLPGSQAAVEESSAADTAPTEESDIEAREASRRRRVSEPVTNAAPAPAGETTSAASSDSDEFVFVRRDGTIFFAAAYSWENGTLRYVTSQGLRHTVTQDALDLDATRQFNEQRGLNFRLPA